MSGYPMAPRKPSFKNMINPPAPSNHLPSSLVRGSMTSHHVWSDLKLQAPSLHQVLAPPDVDGVHGPVNNLRDHVWLSCIDYRSHGEWYLKLRLPVSSLSLRLSLKDLGRLLTLTPCLSSLAALHGDNDKSHFTRSI